MSTADVGKTGEFAASPFDIPRRGWWQALKRVKDDIGVYNLSVLAAGIAFFSFLALFPAIAAFVIVYGMIADPAAVEPQLAPLRDAIPAEAYAIIIGQLKRVAATTSSTLSLGLVFSLGLALWSATKGTKAMLTALDVAYRETVPRNFLWKNVVALLFTIGGMVFATISLTVIAVIPAAIRFLGLGGRYVDLLLPLRWVVMAALIFLALGILYHFGPSRRAPRPVWVTAGAVSASVLWLAGSIGFSFYVTHFGNFNETFGSLGAVVVLLFWLHLSALVVCLGAALNAELEYQTYRDTTVGPARPRGMRRAYVADHTAERG